MMIDSQNYFYKIVHLYLSVSYIKKVQEGCSVMMVYIVVENGNRVVQLCTKFGWIWSLS